MDVLKASILKYKSIHIAIPSPCHESWDKMDKTERGAFCHSCQKEVIDFSAMTDREVIEYLSKNKLGCSRFRADQLDRNITIARVDNGKFRWRALALSLLSLVSIKNIMAQSADSSRVHRDSIPATLHRHSPLSDTNQLREVTVSAPPRYEQVQTVVMGGPMYVGPEIYYDQMEGLDTRKVKAWFQHLFRRKNRNEQKKH